MFTLPSLSDAAKGQPGMLPQVYDHQSALMRDYNPLPSSQLDGGLTGLRLTIEVQAAYPFQAHEALHRWRGTWDPGGIQLCIRAVTCTCLRVLGLRSSNATASRPTSER